jgi:hypothetical protein
MAKKQTRRSISVSRDTYERLRAYCETNGISMSQFVERQVGNFLGATTGLFEHGEIGTPAGDSPDRPKVDDVDDEKRREAAQIFTF